MGKFLPGDYFFNGVGDEIFYIKGTHKTRFEHLIFVRSDEINTVVFFVNDPTYKYLRISLGGPHLFENICRFYKGSL